MCNVFKISFPLIVAMASVMVSCGADKSEEKAAERELASADSLISQGEYNQALICLDSIEAHYPKIIDVRRRVHDLRPVAVEKLTITQIQSADSLIAAAQQALSELEGGFKHISGDGLEGYFLPKSFDEKGFTNTTGVQPRVNDTDGLFYIVASNVGSTLKINQVAFIVGGKEISSEIIPSTSERSSVIHF